MKRYYGVTFKVWIWVEAENEEEAKKKADDISWDLVDSGIHVSDPRM